MEVLSVTGGAPLFGTIPVHGAKNSILPVLAAAVVCRSRCVLHNCPDIADVTNTIQILEYLGCSVRRTGGTLHVDTRSVTRCDVPLALAGRMRSSILFLGALTARTGCASIALPGGCPLGARPIDLHLRALRAMGAEVTPEDGRIDSRAERLHGACIALPIPSVGATENAILTALACPEPVRIENAAMEPEITDLIGFLRSAGAHIDGAGTAEITVHGGAALHGTTYTILPDRIETATYLCAAAACGGDVLLTRTEERTLLPVIDTLRAAGCDITSERGGLRLRRSGGLISPGRIETAPYPAFPTDAQAPVMAALLRAAGTTEFCETVFENRLRHAAQLRKTGAQITVDARCARVRGVERLHGAELLAEDLRGGAAMVVAALSAEGKSLIFGVKHIKRGYDNLEKMLRKLGAEIKYVEI